MTEFAIACGCGRKMTPDGQAGYGAYRCGCGARIKVSLINRPKVTCAGSYSGEPCRSEVHLLDPFPVCKEHYSSSGLQAYQAWTSGAPREIAEEIKRQVLERHRRDREQELTELGLKQVGGHVIAERQHPVVYFLRAGDLVKIGTTVDLVARMKAFNLPTLVVLATEPGYHARERELHQQFSDLRHEREWFRLEEPLVGYINGIRQAHGLPEVTP